MSCIEEAFPPPDVDLLHPKMRQLTVIAGIQFMYKHVRICITSKPVLTIFHENF